MAQNMDKKRVQKLLEKSKRFAFSCERFFQIDISKSNLDGTIFCICSLCWKNEKSRVIEGSFNETSNFKKHIAVIVSFCFHTFYKCQKGCLTLTFIKFFNIKNKQNLKLCIIIN